MRQSLVLLPSQLCNGRIWTHQIEALADLADIAAPAPPQQDNMRAMAAAVLDAAPPRFALAAHGMGGFVALEMLRQQPERVQRLALLGTLASADGPAQIARREGYSRLVEAGRFDAIVEQRLPLLFHPDRAADPALIAIARQMAQETGADRFLQQQRAIITRIDSRPHLAAIAIPTLVIGASEDAVAPPAAIRELAQGIPGARLEIIEGCGHFMQLERPAVVTALLRDWLETRP
jgi:pimeloyl-ACP methyl ester carboxylesterase